MDQRLSRRLLDRSKPLRSTPVGRQIGLVADDSPLTVTVGGEDVPALTLDSYTPSIGDRVYVLRAGQDPPLILGSIS